MPHENAAGLNIHEDADMFAEAINFTSATTGFAARLIEKDYFQAFDFDRAFARVAAFAGRVN